LQAEVDELKCTAINNTARLAAREESTRIMSSFRCFLILRNLCSLAARLIARKVHAGFINSYEYPEGEAT
jgi:hypothetical protein